MDGPAIIIFERQPFWEPELRRQFSGEIVQIRGCRTVHHLDELTTKNSHCIAVVTLADAPADLLRWLSRRLTSGSDVRAIAVANETAMSLRWHACEAGALAVVSEFVGGHQLARLCRKQWPTMSLKGIGSPNVSQERTGIR